MITIIWSTPAVSGSLRILGPVCGYSLAGWSLSYWVDPASPPDIPPRHPSWIGAWWIGNYFNMVFFLSERYEIVV